MMSSMEIPRAASHTNTISIATWCDPDKLIRVRISVRIRAYVKVALRQLQKTNGRVSCLLFVLNRA